MVPLKDFIDRFQEILDVLDAQTDDVRDADVAEALADLNAEYEDMLLALGDIRPAGDGWREEIEDAAEDLEAVLDDYDALAARAALAGIGDPVARARMLCATLRGSLEG